MNQPKDAFNKNSNTHNKTLSDDAKYYIIKLDSYSGEHSSLICSADDEDFMFAVLVMRENSASLVDYGYSSIEQLLNAWNNVEFLNIESITNESNNTSSMKNICKQLGIDM